MSETTFHPVAGLFPMLGEAELDENLATSCEVSAEQRKRAWLSLAELASAPDWLHPALAAPVVRRLGERFQIVEGHHRVEAARRAGLEELPCQVVEMGEEEAFMRLRTGNIQTPLRKIEEGRHLAGYIERHGEAKGGRGQNGGLSAYAKMIGAAATSLQARLEAWRVAENLIDFGEVSADALEAAFSTLKELHAAPKWLHRALATIALGERWDVKTARGRVGDLDEVAEPPEWADAKAAASASC